MFDKYVVVRGGCYNGSDHEHRFHSAGFVDISVVQKVVDVGNWRPEGSQNSQIECLLIMAVEGNEIQALAKLCFMKSVPGAVMNFSEWIPSLREREEFAANVQNELATLNHPLYFILFFRRKAVLIVGIW